MQKINSLLLLGPTGAGKTPLGRELERRGFLNKRVLHFDFGENLRKVASGLLPFAEEEIILVQNILREGRLLKEEEFYLAEKALETFLTINHYQAEDLLVLNGLPRNLTQAKQVESLLEINYIVYLKIDLPTLKLRLSLDPAGDRRGREDDREELIAYKLSWFNKETLPLLAYYQEKKKPIFTVEVFEKDTEIDLYTKLCQCLED